MMYLLMLGTALGVVYDMDMGSSASGWAGAGLLGLVLGWLLLKHLPAKDAQIERLIADFHALDERRRLEDRELRKIERDSCREDHKVLAENLLSNTRETIKLAQETKQLTEAQIRLSDSWVRYKNGEQSAREKTERERPRSHGGN